MLLHIVLQVKFRAFFITFAQFSQTWDIPIPVPAGVPGLIPGASLVHFDKQGVKLDVVIVLPAAGS